jgi:hypothetical protein
VSHLHPSLVSWLCPCHMRCYSTSRSVAQAEWKKQKPSCSLWITASCQASSWDCRAFPEPDHLFMGGEGHGSLWESHALLHSSSSACTSPTASKSKCPPCSDADQILRTRSEARDLSFTDRSRVSDLTLAFHQ